LNGQSVFTGFVMGNPFFPPDIPAQSSFGVVRRHGGRFAPFLMLLIGGAWLSLSIAAIVLTLSDALPADQKRGIFIAELE
jgi:hypothetical protein